MVLSFNDEEGASSNKTYPIQDLSEQTIPYFRSKWSKSIAYFRPKRLIKHTLLGSTYLYSPYEGAFPPPPPPPVTAISYDQVVHIKVTAHSSSSKTFGCSHDTAE